MVALNFGRLDVGEFGDVSYFGGMPLLVWQVGGLGAEAFDLGSGKLFATSLGLKTRYH